MILYGIFENLQKVVIEFRRVQTFSNYTLFFFNVSDSNFTKYYSFAFGRIKEFSF